MNKEQLGIDPSNPYKISNMVFWILVIVVALFFACIFVYIIYDYSNYTPVCKLNGYSEYNPTTTEPGYIRCCRYEFINHIAQYRCDAIKV